MRASVSVLAIGLIAAAGCRTNPPPRVQVPVETRGNDYSTYEHDPVKPLPEPQVKPERVDQRATTAVPEETVISAIPPVSPAYLDAYDRVGRPRLMIVVEKPTDAARSMVPGDYQTLERVMRESLGANGQVAVVPASAASQMNDQQLRDILAGNETAMAGLASSMRADILVIVRVAPGGAERDPAQLTATARNTRDAQPIATAAADFGSPLQRRQIDVTGRLLAQRLIDQLSGAWGTLARTAPPPATTPPAAPPPPAPAPSPAPAPAAPAPPTPPAAPAPPVAPAPAQP